MDNIIPAIKVIYIYIWYTPLIFGVFLASYTPVASNILSYCHVLPYRPVFFTVMSHASCKLVKNITKKCAYNRQVIIVKAVKGAMTVLFSNRILDDWLR